MVVSVLRGLCRCCEDRVGVAMVVSHDVLLLASLSHLLLLLLRLVCCMSCNMYAADRMRATLVRPSRMRLTEPSVELDARVKGKL